MPTIVRWMIRRDLPEVVDIDQRCFADNWSAEDFIDFLRGRREIGLVAEKDNKVIVGYVIYSLTKNGLDLKRFAVDPEHQRRWYGRMLFERLLEKITDQRRNHLRIHIRESNLQGQMYFKSLGFRCVKTHPDHFWERGCEDDGYEFVYTLPTRSRRSEELEGRLVECEELT